jgi:hypothetical protein
MKKKEEENKAPELSEVKYELPDLSYPPSEDIYVRAKEEQDIDPEDITKKKTANPDPKKGKSNEKSFEQDISGDDLDVPGAKLDDGVETNGNEDEENDYFSLGGDEHVDLDEDRGS